jgi:hypothetical protein
VAVDRTGRFAPLKCVAFAGVLAPAAWIVIEARFGWLGERPVMAIYQSGLWAEWLLAVIGISLPKLISVRRILGVNRIWRSPLVSLFLWWATDPGAHRDPRFFLRGAAVLVCSWRRTRSLCGTPGAALDDKRQDFVLPALAKSRLPARARSL